MFSNTAINQQDSKYHAWSKVKSFAIVTARDFFLAKLYRRKHRGDAAWNTPRWSLLSWTRELRWDFFSHRRVPLTSSFEREHERVRAWNREAREDGDYANARIDWASNRRKSPRTWHRAVRFVVCRVKAHMSPLSCRLWRHPRFQRARRSSIALTDVRSTFKFLKRKGNA